jgi:hypothetical protein
MPNNSNSLLKLLNFQNYKTDNTRKTPFWQYLFVKKTSLESEDFNNLEVMAFNQYPQHSVEVDLSNYREIDYF